MMVQITSGIIQNLLVNMFGRIEPFYGMNNNNIPPFVGKTVDLYTRSITTEAYSAITGTQILAPNDDNVNSAATDIGFTFNYDGTDFTQFIASSNGYIRLGSVAPSTTNYTPLSSTTYTIAAVANNGRCAATIGNVQTTITGTSPFRVRVIQYTRYDLLSTATTRRVDFQIRLYETTNVVDIIYNTASGTNTTLTVGVGLRGNLSTSFNNYQGSISSWTALTAGTANTQTVNWGSSQNATRSMPSDGRVLRWTP